MHRLWFNVAVVGLWLTTMSWLVVSKVLPTILVGEPPNYRTILDAQRNSPPVAWEMIWNGRRMGWALNTMKKHVDSLAEMHSRVHFDYLPLADVVPKQFRSYVGSLDELGSHLATDVVSELDFDPLGRVSRFQSVLRFQPLTDVIKVQGVIDGAKLSISVYSGDFSYKRELTVTPKAMLHDAVSPQTHLPGLRVGQTWTEEVYSPLHPPTEPLEVLQVEVEGRERLMWGGDAVETWLVVYRTDPGSGGRSAGKLRGKMWVRRDGTVLQQEVGLLQSTLTFTRMPDDQAKDLAKKVQEESVRDTQRFKHYGEVP